MTQDAHSPQNKALASRLDEKNPQKKFERKAILDQYKWFTMIS